MVKEKVKLPDGNIIPISFDYAFKKMFGDVTSIDRLASLLSIYFKIPFKDLKDNIQILDPNKKRVNKNNKDQTKDVVVRVTLSVDSKVNLEMNLNCKQGFIDRNISYLAELFSNQLKVKDDYSNMEPCIQINFNTEYVDKNNKEIFEDYYLSNKHNYKLTEKFQIHHINVQECRNIWYTDGIKKYSVEEQEIIRYCALMVIDKENDFKKCLGEIKMDKKVKEEIEETVENMSSDEEVIGMYYSKKKHDQAMENTWFSEMKKEAIEEAREENKIEIANRMKKENLDVELISRITGLSVSEINNI